MIRIPAARMTGRASSTSGFKRCADLRSVVPENMRYPNNGGSLAPGWVYCSRGRWKLLQSKSSLTRASLLSLRWAATSVRIALRVPTLHRRQVGAVRPDRRGGPGESPADRVLTERRRVAGGPGQVAGLVQQAAASPRPDTTGAARCCGCSATARPGRL